MALYAAMLGFVLLFVEAFAFATYFVADDLYDRREDVLGRIERERFEEVKLKIDMVVGWATRGPSEDRRVNCLGEEIVYTIDEVGARTYPGYDGPGARVVATGDSYTYGDEARDDETFPARLAALLGVPVANLGVGGFGPVQALLRLESKLARYPEARVAVLGIMYENLHRMVNGYRPVLYDADPYSFKPHIAGGRILPFPAEAFSDLERLRSRAERGFDEDFWARPRHRFPYTASLARGLSSNSFRLLRLGKLLRRAGLPEFSLTFASERVTSELFALLDRFARSARERGVAPVVVFIPRNRLDLESASELLSARGEELDPDLVVGDVARADLDWSRFNLERPEDGNICHPSPYGYRGIAEYVAELLRAEGVWPPAGRLPGRQAASDQPPALVSTGSSP